MNIEKIQRKLEEALQELVKHDSHLLIHGLSEQSITHRLALHLTPKFQEYDVDCEYNGDIDSESQRKQIYGLKHEAQKLNSKKQTKLKGKVMDTRGVFPDIIVHKRGTNEQNILVIEAKKSTSTNINAIDYDIEKLKQFTSRETFNYTLGAFVEFVVGSDPNYKIRWFTDGEEYG